MFGAFLREAQFTDSQAAFLLKPRSQFRAVGAGFLKKTAQTVGTLFRFDGREEFVQIDTALVAGPGRFQLGSEEPCFSR